MKLKGKKSLFGGIPSWGLALLTMIMAFVGLMIVSDIVAAIFKISDENEEAELIFYLMYNLIIAVGCFLICRQDYKSIWYVPILCNVIGIFSAFVEKTFWHSSLWIMICGGWILSLAASLAGYYLGKKEKRL